ncbi:MAG: prolyl oligopeptidase family serine peptidase [Anaerolineae bacterium]|nr:prolyl oligopeptidase family serine peptidase [Anaerolineae bacterium]
MIEMTGSYHAESLVLPYLLYLPPESPTTRLPLIVTLHDADGRGSDPSMLRHEGLPRRLSEGESLPFAVLAPQLADGLWWATIPMSPLEALIDQIVTTHNLDPERVYVLGHGMGGYGAWALALAFPGRFAALVTMGSGGDSEHAALLKDLPAWVIHGGKDPVVLPREAERLVDALQSCGAPVKYTRFDQAGHDVWTRSYASPALYNWLLKHARSA